MSRIKRVKVATREFDAVLKQQDDSELDQSDRNKVGSSSPTSSRGRQEVSSSRNGESKKPNKDDKPDIKEAKSDDVQETVSKEFLEGSKEAAFLSHLPFDEMSSLEAECFSDLQGPSSLALVDIRNRILKMWFENPKKQLTEYAVQKTEAPYNSDPALVLRTHTFLERHGFINCGMYERITLIPNPPSADTQTIKQEPEETKPQVDELPLDPDGAGAMYSLYKDHQIKEEMVISPNVFHTQTYDYSNMQKIKQNPEETQHHVFEVPLDLDGAYSLGDAIKEKKIIGPAVTHTLTSEYSNMQKIKQEKDPEETQHHVFEVPLDLDGAYSLRDAIKEEKTIGPAVTHTLTSECSNNQKIKLEPEKTQHHVDELPLDPDGAYSLYEDHQIKEEMVIGPTELYKLNCQYSSSGSSAAMSIKNKMRDNKETEMQTAKKNLPTTENEYEGAQQNTSNTTKNPVSKSKLSDVFVCVGSQQEISIEAVNTYSKVKINKSVNNSPNSVTVRAENENSCSNRVSGTVICDRVFKYSCDICEYSTNNEKHLNYHLKAHAAADKYYCDMCSYLTTIKRILVRHLKTHSNDKPFVCTTCDAKFIRLCSLKQHLRIHTGEKPYSCEMCHKRFNQKYNLDTHRRIHTGDKPFSCDVCNKRFNDRATLVKHQRIHTGEKPFSCDVCYKGFNQKGNLDTHRRIHTGEKPFSCDACNKSFNERAKLVKHQRIHTGEKPFSCDVMS